LALRVPLAQQFDLCFLLQDMHAQVLV
jgi:hypothetical protein